MANAEVKVAIVGDNSSLQSSLTQSQGKLASFGKAVAGIAVAAGAAAAVGIAALGKASVDAAAQAQQSIGATETVYGKYADTVIKQSRRAAEALGLSGDEYRNNANLLGALLGNQGVAQDKLAGKTRSLIKTGADLAATFGGTTADAVNALASAFKGEFDPLEQYGISIKQSTINTEAYRIAGVKTKGAFDELTASQQAAAKQQATNNLITKQSAKAQGQFARETDTLAHQQQVLGAQWDNLKVKIGNALLPVVSALFKRLSGELMPALNKLANHYLPIVKAALDDVVEGDPGATFDKLKASVEGVDFAQIADTAGDLGDTLKELGPALGDISAATVNDSLKVFSVLIGEAADHLGLVRKVLPLVVAGWVALKSAQLLNNAVGKDSLIGGALQLAQTRQLVTANRELAAAIRETSGAQGSMVSAVGKVTTGMGKLKVAAGVAAGIGGLGAVVASSQVANDKVSGLLSVVGSAAMGAAAGSAFGPWGTAIGGVVGGLGGLVGALGKAKDATVDAKPPASDYASALERLSGASTEAARAEAYRALQGSKVLDDLNSFGISSRQAVSAIMGNKGALEQVNATLAAQHALYDQDAAALKDLATQREADGRALGAMAPAHSAERDALVAKIAAEDKEIARLKESTAARKRALDVVEGEIGRRREQAKGVRDEAEAVHVYGDEINKLPKDKRTLIKADNVATTVKDIAKLAEKYDLARKDVKTLIAASGVDTTVGQVQRVIDRLNSVHDRTVTLTVITNRRGGVTSSAGGHSADPDGTPRKAAVEAAGRTDGKTYGGAFGQGVEDVAKKQSLLVKLFGSKLGGAGLDAINAGIEAAANLIDKVVNKRIKDDKKAAKAQQRILDGLRSQAKALRENGRLQDENTAKLDDARAKVEAYAGAIKESFVSFGDITRLGQTDTGKVTLPKLLRDLGRRAADAREFQQLLSQLADAGLDKAQLEQLTSAGPETALATARAIASGGGDAIRQINLLSRDIGAAGGELGTKLADKFAISGQTSALSYITTLETEQGRLDKTAKRAARAYVKEIEDQFAALNAGGHGQTPDQGNGGNNRVTVTLTSQQLSAMERGREIQLDLDAYASAGGRRRR